jgi:hypothetical protein
VLIHQPCSAQHPVPKIRAQRRFGDEINIAAQCFRELPLDPHEIQQALSFHELREQINIALVRLFAARKGSKEAQTTDAVPLAKLSKQVEIEIHHTKIAGGATFVKRPLVGRQIKPAARMMEKYLYGILKYTNHPAG